MNKFAVNILLLLAAGFTVSCGYFKKEDAGMPIARVENSYLYKEDVAGLVFENASPEDSTTIVNNYINRWATKQLLINKAKINLTPQEQQTYNTMVQEYQNDLYIEAYKNAIVARQLDSSVT
ncbi:MAG: peptidyl-prolyl cis-trans isomerase, partial [Marinirhabdus sp.]